MRQVLILLLRHLMVWKRYFWLYAVYFTLQPLLLLYGMQTALHQRDMLGFLTPGFMVYTVAASCLMGAAYNIYEHTITGQIDSWLGANVTIVKVLTSFLMLQCLRGVVSAASVLVGAWIMMPDLPVHGLFAVFGILILLSVVTSLWGTVLAAKAASINQIYLSDTVIYGIFVFSGIFVATSLFPAPVQWLMWALPFWHAVELVRPLFQGVPLVPVHALVDSGVLGIYLVGGYVCATRAMHQRLIT